jgi:hypothetical protein
MRGAVLAWAVAALAWQGPAVAPDVAATWARVVPLVSAITLNDHENGEVLGTLADQIERVEREEATPGALRLRVTLAPGGADRLRRSECTRDAAAAPLEGFGAPFVCGEARRVVVRVADDRTQALIDVPTP